MFRLIAAWPVISTERCDSMCFDLIAGRPPQLSNKTVNIQYKLGFIRKRTTMAARAYCVHSVPTCYVRDRHTLTSCYERDKMYNDYTLHTTNNNSCYVCMVNYHSYSRLFIKYVKLSAIEFKPCQDWFPIFSFNRSRGFLEIVIEMNNTTRCLLIKKTFHSIERSSCEQYVHYWWSKTKQALRFTKQNFEPNSIPNFT